MGAHLGLHLKNEGKTKFRQLRVKKYPPTPLLPQHSPWHRFVGLVFGVIVGRPVRQQLGGHQRRSPRQSRRWGPLVLPNGVGVGVSAPVGVLRGRGCAAPWWRAPVGGGGSRCSCGSGFAGLLWKKSALLILREMGGKLDGLSWKIIYTIVRFF